MCVCARAFSCCFNFLYIVLFDCTRNMLVMSQVCLVTGLFWNSSATRVIIIKLLFLFLFCFAFLFLFFPFFLGGGGGGGGAGPESSLS